MINRVLLRVKSRAYSGLYHAVPLHKRTKHSECHTSAADLQMPSLSSGQSHSSGHVKNQMLLSGNFTPPSEISQHFVELEDRLEGRAPCVHIGIMMWKLARCRPAAGPLAQQCHVPFNNRLLLLSWGNSESTALK